MYKIREYINKMHQLTSIGRGAYHYSVPRPVSMAESGY